MVFVLRDEPGLVESKEVEVNSRVPAFVKNCLAGFDLFKAQIPLPGGVGALSCKFDIKPSSVSVENGMIHLRQWKGHLTIPSFSDRCNVDTEFQRIYEYLFERGYNVSISSWGRENMAFDMVIPLEQFVRIANGK